MEKTSLSEKIIDGNPYDSKWGEKVIFKADVKSKIQNAQKRLKEEIKHDIKQEDNWEGFEWSIDKIFKEEFGEKLTMEKYNDPTGELQEGFCN